MKFKKRNFSTFSKYNLQKTLVIDFVTAYKTLLKIKILLSFIFLLHHLICRKRWEYAARYGFIPAASYDKSRESMKPLAAFPLFPYSPQIILARPVSASKDGWKGRMIEGWKGGKSGLLKVGRVFTRLIFKNNPDIVALSIQIADLQGWQCVKIGEPAAGFGFLVQIKGRILLLPKSTAAGLLFSNEPSPHYPNPPTPHFHKTLHTPKTGINISIANYKIRRTPHERS